MHRETEDRPGFVNSHYVCEIHNISVQKGELSEDARSVYVHYWIQKSRPEYFAGPTGICHMFSNSVITNLGLYHPPKEGDKVRAYVTYDPNTGRFNALEPNGIEELTFFANKSEL